MIGRAGGKRNKATNARLLVVSLFALLGGCLASASPEAESETPWWERAVPSTAAEPSHRHGHYPHHANLSTPNFEIIGHDPLLDASIGATPTGMSCGGAATREDGQRLAVVHSRTTETAFILADVTDPRDPVKVAEMRMANAVIWDADITPDGMHVLLAANPWFVASPLPTLPIPGSGDSGPAKWIPSLIWVDACTGMERVIEAEEYFPYGPGVVLVGVANPSEPVLEDWKPLPAWGAHSVTTASVDGTTWAAASVTNLVHEISYYTFFHVEATPSGATLRPWTVIQAPGVRATHEAMGAGHVDAVVEKHPLTRQTLAYLAGWNSGLHIYDVSGQVPRHLATWQPSENEAQRVRDLPRTGLAPLPQGIGPGTAPADLARPTEMHEVGASIHTAYPFPTLIDGRHLIAVGQELRGPQEGQSGWIQILDISNPTRPEEVSRWVLPVKPRWIVPLQFSPHYVAVEGSTLFVSHYHAGLWAVDLSVLEEPRAYGVFVPSIAPAANIGLDRGPSVEDVVIDEETGIITTWDANGGLYTLRFDRSVHVPHAPAGGN